MIYLQSIKPNIMKKLLFSIIAIFAIGIAANAANSYTISDEAVDTMIENCIEAPVCAEAPAAALPSTPAVKIGQAPNAWVAFALSFIPVTGWLAVHRMYLGTSVLPVVLNILTGAGFGIVYVVDWVVLLIGAIDNNVGAYTNNPRWLMWCNLI